MGWPTDRGWRSYGLGIAVAAASLAVMPLLVWAKRRVGCSATIVAGSTQTLLCTCLSAVLLVGLLLNAALDWSWADPVAALAIAGVAVQEGIQAWKGEGGGCGLTRWKPATTTAAANRLGCNQPTHAHETRRRSPVG
jgi:hypothetical protein